MAAGEKLRFREKNEKWGRKKGEKIAYKRVKT